MNKLSKDLFFSIVFSVLNVLFNFWLIKEAEFLWAAAVLGTFMLMRRVVPTFTNLSQLGTSQALIRFVSIYKNDQQKIKTYFFLSFFGWIISVIVLLCLYLFLGKTLGETIYDNNPHSTLYFQYTIWYIAIVHLSYLVQPYFLTHRKVIVYNIINTLNTSLFMIIVLKYLSVSATLELFLRHALWLITLLQVALLLFIVIKLKVYILPSIKMIKTHGREFYRYGIPRSLITFSEMLLLTIGSLLVNGGKEIASFLIALVLARIVLIVLQPISKLSSVIVGNNNSKERQKSAINLMTGTILYSTTLLVIILYNWLEVLLKYWLSNADTINNVIYVFNILAFGLIPYAIFHGLKGVIEIKFFKPYNLYTLLIAILLHILVFYVLKQDYNMLYALAFSLLVAFLFLGIATIYWCRKDFYHYHYYRFELLLVMGLLLFLANNYINTIFQNIYGCLISIALTSGIYLFVMYWFKIKFVENAIAILLTKRK